jgi:hypothetical protein
MNYKKLLLIILVFQISIAFAQQKEYSGNPVFKGWYIGQNTAVCLMPVQ